MSAITRAMEIQVCFRSKRKNATITVATDDISEAKRIARMWGEQEEGEPVIRTIFKQEVPVPDRETDIVDGVKIWSPLF